MARPLNETYCYGCPERRDIQVTTVMGQTVYLCKDCLLDWEASNQGKGEVRIVFLDQGLDPGQGNL